MIKNPALRYASWLLLTIWLASCSNAYPQTQAINPYPDETPEQPASGFEEHWLEGVPCRAPCWEGIMPGITKRDEAFTLLKRVNYVKNVNLVEEGNVTPAPEGEINWRWEKSKSIDGRISYEPPGSDGIVYGVFLEPEKGIKLSSIISAYGQPSHVCVREIRHDDIQPTPVEKHYSIKIVWLNNGFSVTGFNSINHGWVDDNFVVDIIELFEPSLEGLRSVGGSVANNLLPWQGYATWEKYLVPIGEWKE
jgi:hypothetical protein